MYVKIVDSKIVAISEAAFEGATKTKKKVIQGIDGQFYFEDQVPDFTQLSLKLEKQTELSVCEKRISEIVTLIAATDYIFISVATYDMSELSEEDKKVLQERKELSLELRDLQKKIKELKKEIEDIENSEG